MKERVLVKKAPMNANVTMVTIRKQSPIAVQVK
jgi:hypothetical protein